MNREAVESLISAIFTGQKTLLAYFGAKNSAPALPVRIEKVLPLPGDHGTLI